MLKPLSQLTRANLDGRPLTNICPTNSPLTPTTRREFTGPRGEPAEKSIKRSVVLSVTDGSDEKGSGSSKQAFTYAIRVNCVSHIELLSVSNLPSGLLTLHATPLFFYFYAVDFIFMQLCVPLFSVWRFWSFELDMHQTCVHFKE